MKTESTQVYHVSYLPSGYGHWKISIQLQNGECYTAITSDSQLIDACKSDEPTEDYPDPHKTMAEYVLRKNGQDAQF